jgi:enterochelin esterase-like enzyme
MKRPLLTALTALALFKNYACSGSGNSDPADSSSGGLEALNGTGSAQGSGGTDSSGNSGGASSGSTSGSGGESAQSGGATSAACTQTGPLNDQVTQPEPYDAPPETLTQADVPQGQLSASALFPSALYGDEFPYRVYVPAQYSAETPAALMVFQDGGLYIDQFKAPAVFDHLIHAGEMPPTIALFLDAPAGGEAKRVEVYDNPSDLYSRFLALEIIPSVITTDYSVSADPDLWATGGFSAGGIQAFAALLYQPNRFHKSLGQNSSFLAAKANGTDFTVLLAALSPAPRFKVSLLSSPNDLSDQRGQWLVGNRDMAETLAENGHDVRFVEGTGGHYPPLQGINDFPDAVRWLWAGCSLD